MKRDGVVLVTGAGKRVGAAIVRRLAADGWRVAVHYRHSRAEAEALAREVNGRAEQADLNDQDSIDAMAARIARSGERWAGLVNNAASFDFDAFGDFSFASAQAALRTNCIAPLYLAKKLWAQAGDGDHFVINIADQKVWNPNPDFFSYTLAKVALAHMTDTLAMALAPKVRANCVAPGLALLSGDQTEENFARVHGRTALGRGTTPEDVADAAAYFASATGVTGASLLVDSGQHLVKNARDVMFD